MAVLLTNGVYYISLNKNGGILKVTDISKAKDFVSVENAMAQMDKAPGRCRNYYHIAIEDDLIIEKKTQTKRKKFSANERLHVYNKNQGRCVICGRFIPYNNFTIDHIVPLAKGGGNSQDNLQCACKVCNAIKQDILPEDLIDKIIEIVSYQMDASRDEKLAQNIIELLQKKYSKFELLKKVIK